MTREEFLKRHSYGSSFRSDLDALIAAERADEARRWATLLCSRHQVPDPECDLCSWLGTLKSAVRVEREECARAAKAAGAAEGIAAAIRARGKQESET